MLNITRHSIKDESLAPWIKFIWRFEAKEADIYYKLLPTDCIDAILNMSGDMYYEVGSRHTQAPPFHINGLRSRHSHIRQAGNIRVLGISFHPYGLYPFVNKSLAGMHENIADLHELSASLAQNLRLAVSNEGAIENKIYNIEKALRIELRVAEGYTYKASLIRDFLELDNDITIQSFCAGRGIHIKTFTRNVAHYTGYAPKALRSVKRFQRTGNQLVHQRPERLSDIAYDNGFADQAHFIREFRKFSGAPPRAFQQERATRKENAEYIYH